MDDLRGARDHYGLANPLNGVEKRLDALIAELRGLRLVLTPATPDPKYGGTIELRGAEVDPEAVAHAVMSSFAREWATVDTTSHDGKPETTELKEPAKPTPPKAKRR